MYGFGTVVLSLVAKRSSNFSPEHRAIRPTTAMSDNFLISWLQVLMRHAPMRCLPFGEGKPL